MKQLQITLMHNWYVPIAWSIQRLKLKQINLSAMFDLGDSADGSSGILCPNTEALAARQLKTGS